MKSFILYCTAVCFATLSVAQTTSKIRAKVDENRYEGKEQDPYLFKEFAKATATKLKTGETHEYLMNYNGHSKKFEVIQDGITSELLASFYDVIEVPEYVPSEYYTRKYVTPSIKFVKGINPDAPRQFSIVIFEGEHAMLYKNFTVEITTREMDDPLRGVVKRESFIPHFQYHLKRGAELKAIGLNKKIASELENPKVASFMKKNKLKGRTEDEMAQVVAYYCDLMKLEGGDGLPVASANN